MVVITSRGDAGRLRLGNDGRGAELATAVGAGGMAADLNPNDEQQRNGSTSASR